MDTIERNIFENAIAIMGNEDLYEIVSRKILKDKNNLKRCILNYFESTEEYEKCLEVLEFFKKLENE